MVNTVRQFFKDYSQIFKNLGVGAGVLIAGLAIYLGVQNLAPRVPEITHVEDRFGWAGPEEAAKAWNEVKGEFPLFEIKNQTEDTKGKRVVLWEFAKKVNGGKHLPTLRQQVGSCVGHGMANAIWYRLCVQAAQGRAERVLMVYEPSCYGFMREAGGFRINGDGGVGAWGALAGKKFGFVVITAAGLPEWSTTEDRHGTTISFPGSVDRKWGNRPGVPQQYRPEAAKHVFPTIAQVSTYEEVRDALCNGYPVTVASMQGFDGGIQVDKGKHWGIPRGQWAHQMCFIGVDDNPERPGCYCLNSWGADAHGKPADDAPPGGFWVDAKIVARMVGQDDSFAWSDVPGFPEDLLDWDIFKQGKARRPANPPKIPESSPDEEQEAALVPNPRVKTLHSLISDGQDLSALIQVFRDLGLGNLVVPEDPSHN